MVLVKRIPSKSGLRIVSNWPALLDLHWEQELSCTGFWVHNTLHINSTLLCCFSPPYLRNPDVMSKSSFMMNCSVGDSKKSSFSEAVPRALPNNVSVNMLGFISYSNIGRIWTSPLRGRNLCTWRGTVLYRWTSWVWLLWGGIWILSFVKSISRWFSGLAETRRSLLPRVHSSILWGQQDPQPRHS